MKIYIRKIDNQCIAKQISYTKDILKDFLDGQADHSTITCVGKQSKEQVQVALLLATDPRFDKSMQKILRAEGDLAIGDLMVMYKLPNKYIVELIKPTDDRHASYLRLFENDRHILMNIDDNDDTETNSSCTDIFNHNVYGIHIKKDNDALSEDRPHICIGWSGMNDLSGLNTKDEVNARHASTYPDASPNSRGQDVGQIHRFKNEAKVGDYVVFAEQNVCHIGRITSEYYYDTASYPNQSDDYVNVRDVEWLKTNIKRSDLSSAFHNSLGAGMSFWGLNDYKSAIAQLLDGSYIKEDIVLDEADLLLEKDGFSSNLTAEELVEILNNMYNSANDKNKSNAIRMFGFKFAESIMACGVAPQKLVDDSIIDSNSYGGEITKAINMYNSIKNNEYGVAFAENQNLIIGASSYDFAKGKGINKIFYGTPGCGKSYHIQHNILEEENYAADNVIRTTFYQDYSNTDFVGQILPKIEKDAKSGKETVKYIFNPGPFTLALIRAISNPTEKVALVVEEINRGNAPAIFGDIFQLLDRDADGISEYGIVNVSVLDYLNDYVFEVNGEKKNYIFKEIKIPGNMDIFATMNTSDQNVYTLDTAFVRRWDKEKIKNSFADCKFAGKNVPGMNYTWQEFVTAVNNHIAKHLEDLQVNEDKQIGVFFVKESLLGSTPEKFAYKVFDYLWSDVAKLDHGIFFNHFDTLEALITAYEKDGVGVFKTGIFDKKETPQTVEEDENNE